jgi:hypothetical protein
MNGKKTNGVGVTGLLQVAFIVLKLCGVIKWSWWWVLSPIWISTVIVALILLAYIILDNE